MYKKSEAVECIEAWEALVWYTGQMVVAMSMTTVEVEAVAMGNDTWNHPSVQSDDPF